MKSRAVLLLLLGVFSLLLTACGSGMSGSSSSSSVVANSASCLASNCHDNSYSKVTGINIKEEWKASIHYKMNVAGCVDCHSHAHASSCTPCHGGSGPIASTSSIGNESCYTCHDNSSSVSKGKLALDWKHLSRTKFVSMTSGVLPNDLDSVGYAVSRGTSRASKCNWCHNPHYNNITEQHREWSESGHGEPRALPFMHYDFKTRGTDNATTANSTATDCVRCHTTTGYINYVSSNFTDISPWGAYRKSDGTVKIDPVSKSVVPMDNQKQVIYCNVCHDAGNHPLGDGVAYGFERRRVPKVTAYYNYQATVSGVTIKLNATREADYPNIVARFDDLATSNMCLACHVGRESGDTLQALGSELVKISPAATDMLFKNVGFINSHYLTAGATLFRKSGYEFPGRNYNDDYAYKHKSLGVGNSFGTGNDGPCVTCHLKSDSPATSRHSFMAVSREPVNSAADLPLDQTITKILSPFCANCHYNGSATSFDGSAVSAQSIKSKYRAALDVMQIALEKYRSYYFFNAHPYFYVNPYVVGYKESGACSNNVAVKNWLTGADPLTWDAAKKSCTTLPLIDDAISGTGEANMGAAFNFNLLFHDYGAFAHNSRYVKRLIYDSFDSIDHIAGSGFEYSVRTILNDWYLNLPGSTNPRPAALTQQQVEDAMDYLLIGGHKNGTGTASAADRY